MAYRVLSSGRGSSTHRLANSPEARAWSCCFTSTNESEVSRTITRRSLPRLQVSGIRFRVFARRSARPRGGHTTRGEGPAAVRATHAEGSVAIYRLLPVARCLQNRTAVHGERRGEAVFEKGLLRLVEEVRGNGGEGQGEAAGERVRPLLGRSLG